MKPMKGLLYTAVIVVSALSGIAHAQGTASVNGYTFYCQNACVVSVASNGGMQVSDSGGGWVRIYTSGGHLPVPQ